MLLAYCQKCRERLHDKLGDEAFKLLAAQMSRVYCQVSIGAFRAISDGILEEFAAARDYLIPISEGDKVQKWAPCFKVRVSARGIVSTQHVQDIHRLTKDGRLNP